MSRNPRPADPELEPLVERYTKARDLAGALRTDDPAYADFALVRDRAHRALAQRLRLRGIGYDAADGKRYSYDRIEDTVVVGEQCGVLPGMPPRPKSRNVSPMVSNPTRSRSNLNGRSIPNWEHSR